MSDKTQKTVVTRVLTILAAIVVLAVSAAPAASAKGGLKGIVTDNKDPDKLGAAPHRGAIIYNGHAGLGANIKGRKT